MKKFIEIIINMYEEGIASVFYELKEAANRKEKKNIQHDIDMLNEVNEVCELQHIKPEALVNNLESKLVMQYILAEYIKTED